MAETIKPYDTANYLRDEADIAAYLQAAAEDGDPTGMAMALGAVARARSMSQLARDTGITREGLYKALSPGGNPSFATVAKVAAALGHPVTFAAAVMPTTAMRAMEAFGADLDQPYRRANNPDPALAAAAGMQDDGHKRGGRRRVKAAS